MQPYSLCYTRERLRHILNLDGTIASARIDLEIQCIASGTTMSNLSSVFRKKLEALERDYALKHPQSFEAFECMHGEELRHLEVISKIVWVLMGDKNEEVNEVRRAAKEISSVLKARCASLDIFPETGISSVFPCMRFCSLFMHKKASLCLVNVSLSEPESVICCLKDLVFTTKFVAETILAVPFPSTTEGKGVLHMLAVISCESCENTRTEALELMETIVQMKHAFQKSKLHLQVIAWRIASLEFDLSRNKIHWKVVLHMLQKEFTLAFGGLKIKTLRKFMGEAQNAAACVNADSLQDGECINGFQRAIEAMRSIIPVSNSVSAVLALGHSDNPAFVHYADGILRSHVSKLYDILGILEFMHQHDRGPVIHFDGSPDSGRLHIEELESSLDFLSFNLEEIKLALPGAQYVSLKKRPRLDMM